MRATVKRIFDAALLGATDLIDLMNRAWVVAFSLMGVSLLGMVNFTCCGVTLASLFVKSAGGFESRPYAVGDCAGIKNILGTSY
jgi:hypothetical protein